MKKPLNNKIFGMLTVLVLLTTLALLLVVWDNASKSLAKNLAERLELAKTVVVRELVNRQHFVLQNSKVLLDDYGFKRSLAAKNTDDIEQALGSFRQRMNAAFIKIQTPNDDFEATSGHLSQFMSSKGEDIAIRLTNEDGDFANLVVLDQKLVWVLWTPIKDSLGETSAYAAMGFIVDERYIQSIKQVVALDLSILVNASRSFIVSSIAGDKLDLGALEESLISQDQNSFLLLSPLKSGKGLFSSKFELPNLGDVSPTIYLSIDGSQIQSNFFNLQLTITAIALFALLCAISAGRVLANQITRPIEYMAQYADNIANGKYSKGIELEAKSQELSLLLSAFQTMESNVKTRESEIFYQAQHDILTGLYNRNYVTKHIDSLLQQKTKFQAVGINIQRFRTINDIFGYQYGDLCLQELARRIENLGGVAARLEGGEILWLPKSPLRLDELKHLKIDIEKPVHGDNVNIPLTLSLGIVNCPSDTRSAEDLYRRLNIVIDQAQMDKSMVVEFENALEANYLRRLSIVEKLEKAIAAKSHDIRLQYQPKLDLKTGTVKCVEALIRWSDKDLGHIPPDEFIGIAEQAGLINMVTKRVLNMAISDIVMLKEQGLNICVAVNISAKDILHEGFLEYLLDLLDKNQLKPSVLSLELTESVIMQEPEKSIQQMQLFRDAGFSIAIDDFGTGYSSFEYITQLPVDTIKIDKCFVMPIANKQGEQVVCQAILSVANSFSMTVVAEGIEDQESLNLLSKWGCDFAQGYHIARPMPPEQLNVWLKTHQSPLLINKAF